MIALIQSELMIEFRNPTALMSAALFALLALLTQSLSVPSAASNSGAAFAVFFISACFAGLLIEHERLARGKKTALGAMLALSPAGAPAIFTSRAIVGALLLVLTEVCLFPFLVVFFNVPLGTPLVSFAAIAVCADIALAELLTLFGAAGGSWKSGGSLALPVLILPLAFPILALSTVGCARAFSGMPGLPFVKLLFASDVVLGVAGAFMYGKLLGKQ